MTCRSLAPCAGVQKAVLGGEVMTGAETMKRFVGLVDEDKGLPEVLRNCKTQAGLKPLQDYRAALAARGDDVGAKRVRPGSGVTEEEIGVAANQSALFIDVQVVNATRQRRSWPGSVTDPGAIIRG